MKDFVKTDANYDMPIYLFQNGENYEAYKFLGVHRIKGSGQDLHCFRVWAPNALEVSLVGPFNEWDHEADPMYKISAEILTYKTIYVKIRKKIAEKLPEKKERNMGNSDSGT